MIRDALIACFIVGLMGLFFLLCSAVDRSDQSTIGGSYITQTDFNTLSEAIIQGCK